MIIKGKISAYEVILTNYIFYEASKRVYINCSIHTLLCPTTSLCAFNLNKTLQAESLGSKWQKQALIFSNLPVS